MAVAAAADNLNAAIASNAETIARYAAALSADAITPLPDYSLDGESVSRDDWRRTLTAAIRDLSATNKELFAALIQIEGPTELRVVGTT